MTDCERFVRPIENGDLFIALSEHSNYGGFKSLALLCESVNATLVLSTKTKRFNKDLQSHTGANVLVVDLDDFIESFHGKVYHLDFRAGSSLPSDLDLDLPALLVLGGSRPHRAHSVSVPMVKPNYAMGASVFAYTVAGLA